VKLQSEYKGKQYPLKLQNVLHVPGTRNNLISLGRWDAEGCKYIGKNGQINLITSDGKTIAKGNKITNNLYKMHFTMNKLEKPAEVMFHTTKAESWDMWHKHFGHVSYDGLQKLLDNKMVNGFNIDKNSDKSNCIACMEAKLMVKLFNGKTACWLEPRQLTHINVWGKYKIASINHNHYFVLLVDDTSRYANVHFLKTKDQAAQAVKNYMTYLKTQGKAP